MPGFACFLVDFKRSFCIFYRVLRYFSSYFFPRVFGFAKLLVSFYLGLTITIPGFVFWVIFLILGLTEVPFGE